MTGAFVLAEQSNLQCEVTHHISQAHPAQPGVQAATAHAKHGARRALRTAPDEPGRRRQKAPQRGGRAWGALPQRRGGPQGGPRRRKAARRPAQDSCVGGRVINCTLNGNLSCRTYSTYVICLQHRPESDQDSLHINAMHRQSHAQGMDRSRQRKSSLLTHVKCFSPLTVDTREG